MAGKQTDNPQPETNEHCVSRVNPIIVSQEEHAPNEAPPTVTNIQLEASYHIITEGIVAIINRAARTQRCLVKKLQNVRGVKFIAALPERTEI